MEKSAFVIYLICIVFGVLLFGALHVWVYTIVFLGVLAASLLMLKGAVVKGERDGRPGGAESGWYLRWVKTDLDPLFFFFFAFLTLQMVPLPQELVGLVSPETKIAREMSQPAAASLNPESLKGQWYAIAPYLFQVRMSFIRWTVYGLLFFGLVRCLNSRKRVEVAAVTILLLALFDALYGIMQTYSGHGHIWWFKLSDNRSDVSGTFLNRNLFAGFLEIAIALTAAYAAGLGGGGKGQAAPPRRRSAAKRLLAFFSESPTNPKGFLIVFAGGVLGLGLILSSSRGGIIAMTGALLMMGLFFYFRKSERRKGRIILVLFGIAMLFAIHAGLDYTIGRFYFFDDAVKDRGIMAEKALILFKDYKITGVGMGNLRHTYGKYQDPIHTNLSVGLAHNDYAQFLAEAGIVGAILLLAGLGWYIIRVFRIWKKQNDSFAVCLGIAPFAALFAVAIHAFSDFNLHRPAHMMVLVAVVAIGYAALHLEQGRRNPRTSHPARMIPLLPWGALLLASTVVVILWCGVWTVRHFIAESYCGTDINVTLNLDQDPSVESIRNAKRWNPIDAIYPFKLARALMAVRDMRMRGRIPDQEGWRQSHGPIIAELEQAVRLNPMNPEYHIRLAWEYSYLWDRPDYLAKWLPAADVCMDRAAYVAGGWPQNPKLHYDMGNYWTMRTKSLGADDPKSKISWTKAARHYRQGMALEKAKELPKDVRAYIGNFFPGEPPIFP